VNHSHQSHLNQIHIWHELNRKHFYSSPSIRYTSFNNSVWSIWRNWDHQRNLACWWIFMSWVLSMVSGEKLGYCSWFPTNSMGEFWSSAFEFFYCYSF
jgi:hypothetical protein